MKKRLIYSALALSTILIAGCDKDKRAEFTLDKTEYLQGDYIKTTNTTIKGSKFYRWNFGGTELYEKAPLYAIPANQTLGEFVITCEATNDKNSSSSARSSTKTVMIKEVIAGKLVFWREASPSNVSIAIKLSGNGMASQYDTITYSNVSDPACNFSSSNAVFEKLKAGNYSFNATDLLGGLVVTGSVTLSNGLECKSQKIF